MIVQELHTCTCTCTATCIYFHVHAHFVPTVMCKCMAVVCAQNWLREFKKWLGSERLKVYAVTPDTKMEVPDRTCLYIGVMFKGRCKVHYLLALCYDSVFHQLPLFVSGLRAPAALPSHDHLLRDVHENH